MLLVEGDRALAARHRARLELEGYGVLVVSDPAEAVGMAREARPDLICVGLGRDLEGVQAVDAVRADAGTKDLPVLILSLHSEQALRRLGLTLGASDYVIDRSALT